MQLKRAERQVFLSTRACLSVERFLGAFAKVAENAYCLRWA
jgi:hypothetical protein